MVSGWGGVGERQWSKCERCALEGFPGKITPSSGSL